MQSKMLLATTLLATAVSANFMAHPLMKRELDARATMDDTTIATTGISSPECQTAILSAYKDVPTPPSDIVSDLLEHPQTDPCKFTTPASLSKQYKSYSSEVMSWYSKNEDEISSALEECPALSDYTGIAPCSTKGSGSDAKATGTDASATGADATATGDSKATSTGGAAHQTGMAVAVMAVAGAVVAML
ncbi:hypothetical protein AK830_g12153 [Neonectria ditissima]|uniref:DUF7735 domain-containing protein n=1 Tax=Neonectria ditissima TaxID=78410 RepID=A0A0P7AQ09_9HYPO|nr:hypothetical protein AK830_g12153 [Neonectria ditissima]